MPTLNPGSYYVVLACGSALSFIKRGLRAAPPSTPVPRGPFCARGWPRPPDAAATPAPGLRLGAALQPLAHVGRDASKVVALRGQVRGRPRGDLRRQSGVAWEAQLGCCKPARAAAPRAAAAAARMAPCARGRARRAASSCSAWRYASPRQPRLQRNRRRRPRRRRSRRRGGGGAR